jgi:hypothetical protein
VVILPALLGASAQPPTTPGKRWKKIGVCSRLPGPQGFAVAGRFVYVATGGNGRLHRFDNRMTLAPRSVEVVSDADNVGIGVKNCEGVGLGGNKAVVCSNSFTQSCKLLN